MLTINPSLELSMVESTVRPTFSFGCGLGLKKGSEFQFDPTQTLDFKFKPVQEIQDQRAQRDCNPIEEPFYFIIILKSLFASFKYLNLFFG